MEELSFAADLLDVSRYTAFLRLGLPFAIVESHRFHNVVRAAKNASANHKVPHRKRICGKLLDMNHEQVMDSLIDRSLLNANLHGIQLCGDGATIRKMPLFNVLASGTSFPLCKCPSFLTTEQVAAGLHCAVCCLDVVDCTHQPQDAGVKDARFLVGLVVAQMDRLMEVARKKETECWVDLVMFDGAANVQSAGRVLAAKYPWITSVKPTLCLFCCLQPLDVL